MAELYNVEVPTNKATATSFQENTLRRYKVGIKGK
jgi:hypothetical protein